MGPFALPLHQIALLCTLPCQHRFSVVDAANVLLRGAGASFPHPVYNSWIVSFTASRHEFVKLNHTYSPVGSGDGKVAIKAGPGKEVEYAGSDSLLDPDDYVKYPDLKMFPTMAGAIVLAYNIPQLKKTPLQLTREEIVGIYNGTIVYWDDRSLQESNPGAILPHQRIRVVARADQSGSTDMFTEALCLFSEEWKNRPRQGRFSKGRDEHTGEPHHWDPDVVKLFGLKTRGMSGLIQSIRYTIGYLSVADTEDANGITYALLQNKAGHYIKATQAAVQRSMEYFSNHTYDVTISIADSSGASSYPIAGFTYFIIYLTKLQYCDRAIELVRYIEWYMTDSGARRECERKNMVPLSDAVVTGVMNNVIKKMACGPNEDNVWDLVIKQKDEEYWKTQTWRNPVAITTSLLLAIAMGICIYFLFQRHKTRKKIDTDEWDIPIEDIIFYFDEKYLSGGKSKLSGYRSVKSFKSIDDIPEGADLLTQILQWPGKWQACQVGLRLLEVKQLSAIRRETKKTMIWMRDSVIHTNVLRFFGLTELDNNRYVIGEYCGKGAMTDILHDDKYNFTSDFKFSLSNDIAAGLHYLHSHNITHGNLKSSCCLIDSRWNVKVADWEYCKLLMVQNTEDNPIDIVRRKPYVVSKNVAAFAEFWTDPTILKSEFQCAPSQSCDVYSFSVILQEIFTREDPYSEHAGLMSPEDVLQAIRNNGLRPQYSNDTPVGVRQIMEIGWADEPAHRPTVEQIIKMLRHANPTKKGMLDSMMETMEEYTAHLEERIEERTSELMVAKQNMETVLSGVIPPHIASKIANGQTVTEERYHAMALLSVEILDFPDFAKFTSTTSAVAYLNHVNGELETLIKKYEIFRASVEGDNYTLVSGFSAKAMSEDSAAIQIAHLALDIMETVLKLPQPSFHTQAIRLRYGAHVGHVVGALVGACSPRYCLLGSAVKTAVILRNSSLPGKIHISEDLRSAVERRGFHTEERTDPLEISDCCQKTYWLTGRDFSHIDLSSDLSTDSGIDGVLAEKHISTKQPEMRVENTPGSGSQMYISPTECSTMTSKSSNKNCTGEKSQLNFTNWSESPSKSSPVNDDIELIDLSHRVKWGTTDDSVENSPKVKETLHMANTSSMSTREKSPPGHVADDTMMSACRGGCFLKQTDKPRAKSNRIAPTQLV